MNVFSSIICCLLALFHFVSCSPVPVSEETKDIKFFLNRLGSEDVWLDPIPEEQTFMASSNQPVLPRDCNNFLKTEEEEGEQWHVLVDLEGPGVITRFWTPNRNQVLEGQLEIYIDDSLTIHTTMSEFFSGEYYPFISPLVFSQEVSSGGRVSYFPIPFSDHIKIRSNSTSHSFYWQINYSLFNNIPVKSFDPQLDEEAKKALEAVSISLNAPDVNAQGLSHKSFTAAIDAQSNHKLSIEGEGVIRKMQIQISQEDLKYANDIELAVTYGADTTSAVRVKLLDLFHIGCQPTEYQSKYSSFQDNLLTFRMPLPFDEGLTLEFTNPTQYHFQNLQLDFDIETIHTGFMQLHAITREFEVKYGDTLQLLDTSGKGVFAGFNLTTLATAAQTTPFFNQEGNEYIFADDSLVWKGTGTEDYFNSGYYYAFGEFALPLHGCLLKSEDEGGKIMAYRIQKLDAVKFNNHIKILLEAGCPKKGKEKGVNGELPLHYVATLFYYLAKSS